MDNGSSNGIHNNKFMHETMTDGNGTASGNGSNDGLSLQQPDDSLKKEDDDHVARSKNLSKMGALPPEIKHITEGFLSLPRLLARRAQVSHNTMIQMIQTMSEMPLTLPQTNGFTDASRPDDTSVDNMKKKVQFLKYAEKEHADWVKALVITSWARVSDDVRKLIDLKVHIDTERLYYDFALDRMVEVKRNLIHARLPNPDLRTALETLSTAKASWMPDIGYIEAPPLTAEELLQSLQDLNITLATRLNLYEHGKIPSQFGCFSIGSGRVTFRVDSEFELDLTIAEDSRDAQFWFIDFRFLFSPKTSHIPTSLFSVIENRVNALLEKDGLLGAYKYLHELTLTYKMGELKRQTQKLCMERWEGSLRIEPLHRALSIQYWMDRHGVHNPKNWILIGVHSGRSAMKDEKSSTSRIQLRWFRDAVEVKDFEVELDLENLCTEQLLQAVITEHTFHILHGIYSSLRSRSLYQELLEVKLHMDIGMRLEIQLTRKDTMVIRIEPVTGRYAISGASSSVMTLETKLNGQPRTHVAVAQEIENFRSRYMCDKIVSQSSCLGWAVTKNPGVSVLDIKAIVPVETIQMAWLKRPGWPTDWFVCVASGSKGESFWLYRISRQATTMKIRTSISIPQTSSTPELKPRFYLDLHVVSAALISSYHNLESLRSMAIPDSTFNKKSTSAKVPALLISLAKIMPSVSRPWAKDVLKMSFLDVETGGQILHNDAVDIKPPPLMEVTSERAILVVEATMIKPLAIDLRVTEQQVDKDITFHPTSGAFAIRLYQRSGESVMHDLKDRLSRIEQLVQFMHIIKKHSPMLRLEDISLGKISLSYNMSTASTLNLESSKHFVSIIYGKGPDDLGVVFEKGNPHIHLVNEFTRIINSRESLNGVATYLFLTLPVLKAFNDIEDAWDDDGLGEALLLSRAIDHHIITWTLPKTDLQVDMEMKVQSRNGQAWWSVKRLVKPNHSADSVDTVLKEKVWSVKPLEASSDWAGMDTSAIVRDAGVQTVLGMINQVMKELSSEVKVVEDVPKSLISKEPAPILPPKKPQPTRPTVQYSTTGYAAKTGVPPSLMNRAVSNQQQSRLQTQQQQHQHKKKKGSNTIVID